MTDSGNWMDVYVEIGKKRTFAGAIAWPGWCRNGRDEESALRALLDYGPRYAGVLGAEGLDFRAPEGLSAFTVVERLEGNATTDFGAPDVAPSSDTQPIDDVELRRLQAVLRASWRAFDAAVTAARGQALRKGPRGGGRDLERIVEHVLGADIAYLARLGWRFKQSEEGDLTQELHRVRRDILEALAQTPDTDVAPRGPRGGVRWVRRYFVRRVAWHVLDHAWEIEDRRT